MYQSENFHKAAAYSRQHGGQSFLVMRGGKIIFEDYHDADGATLPHKLASGTKSFWGVLAMAAVQDGLLTLDEPVVDTITEWREDPRKSQITVRHLLAFTSGLESGKGVLEGNPHQKDIFARVIDIPSRDMPGNSFTYGPSHLTAFGLLLKRKLGADPVKYLERRVFHPIDLTVANWTRDKVGNPIMAAGAWTTAREWAKFGELLNKRGIWLDNQLVRSDLLDIMLTGSTANPGYGMTVWLNVSNAGRKSERVRRRPSRAGRDDSGRPSPGSAGRRMLEDIIAAGGKGDQRLFIIRSLDTVIVRQGDSVRHKGSGQAWSDKKFLALLLGYNARDPRSPRRRGREGL
ncbi:MAG: serine hydrolase [Gammaproteobacteria bacterium]|nr:serine hydrolase [Gammaproteobacteria bacterium]NNJ83710.1 serine hydrolase [Gammaproteobacteria bacterium]